MKKNLFLILILSGVVCFLGCAKKDEDPASSKANENILGPPNVDKTPFTCAISGSPFILSPSAKIDWLDSETWIRVEFNTRMNTTASESGIKLIKVEDHLEVPINCEWTTGVKTILIVKPQTDFENNRWYIFKVVASDVEDVAGNMMDNDNDGIQGEDPDDNVWDRFLTVKADGNPGTDFFCEDDIKPQITRGLYFVQADTEVVQNWMDVDITVNFAVDIKDWAYDDSGYVVPKSANSAGDINTNTVVLKKRDSGVKVQGSVSYESDPDTSTFGRVVFDPDSPLEEGVWYKFEIYGDIADVAGNKLDPANIVTYTANFFTHIEKTLPEVDDLQPHADHFTLVFNKLMNESTITGATVKLTSGGNQEPGIFSFGKIIGPDGLQTTVSFYPVDPSITSGDVWVSRTVKDTEGFMMMYDYYDTW